MSEKVYTVITLPLADTLLLFNLSNRKVTFNYSLEMIIEIIKIPAIQVDRSAGLNFAFKCLFPKYICSCESIN